MIQVYTGNGKGKTTAAFGLALRAAGAGLKVYICQFLKGKYCCELISLKKFKDITIEQFGNISFVRRRPTAKDIDSARQGLEAAKKAIQGKKYAVIILDEINVALKLGLLELNEVLLLIKKYCKVKELILTGRNAHPKIIEIADLVSEIKDKKHYYKKGTKARRGIEF